MKDALTRLFEEESECCLFFRTIIGRDVVRDHESEPVDNSEETVSDQIASGLNSSQQAAVRSCEKPLTLIWGPPGLSNCDCFLGNLC